MSETKNYGFYQSTKPVGYWVMYSHSNPHTKFGVYHKPKRFQIWFTELLLGWKWEDV